jgi:hypothetical protein
MPRIKKRAPRAVDVPAKARGLLELPNVGPATALDLVRLGIFESKALKNQNADKLYAKLCKIDGVRHDPCVIDVFASLVAFANGAPARPWWHYTPERKRRQKTGRATRARRA